MFDCRTGIYRMTTLLCPFVFSRLTERTGIFMSKKKADPRIPLFRERKEPKNKDKFIYGTENDEQKRKDTFELAFARYLSDSGRNNKKVSTRTLSVLTGISKSEIHYYLHGERRITYELLCAVCIALRLPLSRQEHLFHKAHIMYPCSEPYPSDRDEIIRYHLEHCSDLERVTVRSCNEELIRNNCDPLNELTSDKEDSK